MNPQNSLQCLQHPTTCPYPEPTETNHTLNPISLLILSSHLPLDLHFSEIHFNVSLLILSFHLPLDLQFSEIHSNVLSLLNASSKKKSFAICSLSNCINGHSWVHKTKRRERKHPCPWCIPVCCDSHDGFVHKVSEYQQGFSSVTPSTTVNSNVLAL